MTHQTVCSKMQIAQLSGIDMPCNAEHSDPDKLRQQAEGVKQHEAVKDFLERKQRVAEVTRQQQYLAQQQHH